MKLFARPPRVGGGTARWYAWVAGGARRVSTFVTEINLRIDQGHEVRDRANQQARTVDSGFWIYLR